MEEMGGLEIQSQVENKSFPVTDMEHPSDHTKRRRPLGVLSWLWAQPFERGLSILGRPWFGSNQLMIFVPHTQFWPYHF